MKDATGKEWSSRSLMKCYDQAAESFGWSKRDTKPGSMRDGDWLIGWGCASAVYPTHLGAATARVQLQANGKAQVQIAAHEIGTGVRTVVAQMAAERLGIPVSAVTVETGDSALPPSPVAGGSNQTASCCSVVMKACDAIKAQAAARPTTRPAAAADAGENARRTSSSSSASAPSRNTPNSCRRRASPTPSRSSTPARRCSAAAPRAKS